MCIVDSVPWGGCEGLICASWIRCLGGDKGLGVGVGGGLGFGV